MSTSTSSRLRVVRVSTGVCVAVLALEEALAVTVAPSEADRARARELPHWRAREYLGARKALRALLRAVAGTDAASATLATTPLGRPYLPSHPDIAVSLSHSGGWVAAAVADRPVGVDVQRPEPVAAPVIARCCTNRDARWLASLPADERARQFAWVWSAQEACVKASGEGLSGRPWSIPVAVRARCGQWNGHRWHCLRGVFALPVSCAYALGSAEAIP